MKKCTVSEMDRQEALVLLTSSKVTDRRLAARRLAIVATGAEVGEITRQLATESDVWVRQALGATLDRLGGRHSDQSLTSGTSLPEISVEDSVWAKALADTTERFLHELAPIVGEIARRAEKEVENYESSATKAAILRAERYLDGMRRLRTVAGFPEVTELNLTDVIANVVDLRRDHKAEVEVVLTRDEPLYVLGDRTFLEFAIDNGLKNAIEASKAGQTVLVNCGATDKDAWVTVLDEGEGLPAGADKVWETGKTTKSKAIHAGLGLSIAQRAMISMGGTAEVRDRRDRGVEFELRWPQEDP